MFSQNKSHIVYHAKLQRTEPSHYTGGPQENGTIRNYSIVIISVPKYYIISTDKDPNLRIESFPMINLRGVSTKRNLSHEILISLLKNVFLCFAF